MGSLHVAGDHFESDEVEADAAPLLAAPEDPEGLAHVVLGATAARDHFALTVENNKQQNNKWKKKKKEERRKKKEKRRKKVGGVMIS